MIIQVWIEIRHMEWKTWVFVLPPDACALVEAGLRKLMPFTPHPEYVQFIYEIGGHGHEYNFFFAGCV